MRGEHTKVARRILILCALSLPIGLLPMAAVAQETGSVTGQITEATSGQPLAGVQLLVVGTNIGNFSDQEGRYVINSVPAGSRQVRAIFLGYGQVTQEVTVSAGSSATLDFEMTTSALELGAITVNAVTGRAQRARELGSKVASIDVEAMNPAPITSFADVLSGRSEGVIMQDVNGTTGTSQRIRIRGANSLSLSNEPLIYVDGIQFSNDFDFVNEMGVGGQEPNRLNDINPNDIESVEIVKGPAASALYGTAAANGVILITTKRGRPGTTQWSFFAETGWLDDITDYPSNYASYQANDPSQPVFNEDGTFNSDAYSFCPNVLVAEGECRQDGTESFNTLEDARTTPFSTGTRERYGLSVRGGNETVRYFVSGQFEDETGVIDYNTQQKVNFRGNVDARLSEHADLSVSFGYSDGDLGLNNNDNSIFSPLINGLTGEAFYIQPSEDAPDVENISNYGFGFNQSDLSKLVTSQEVDRYTTSVRAEVRPTTWLTLVGTGGLDLTTQHDFEALQVGDLPIGGEFTLGFRASGRTTGYLYTGTVSAASAFQLSSDILSTTTVGSSYTRENSTNTYCFGASLIPGTSSCGTTSSLFNLDEDFFEARTIGAHVQQELGWRDRVFVAGALRGDDNSAFGADFGFVVYPSASLSWVVGDEDWFPESRILNDLRLRSAWGKSGLRPDFRDAVTLFESTTVASPAGDVPGLTLSSSGNLELEPETSTEFEIGFDAGLFDSRLALDFTYFNKESGDALIERRLPGSAGLTTTRFENLGRIRNSGTELTARLAVVQTGNMDLSLGFTNTSLDNEIEELGEGIEPIVFNRGIQRHDEGHPAGSFFQREISYDDANGDGVLSRDEVTLADSATFIGPSLPTWQRTVFANLRLFDWINVSTLVEGRGGHYTGNDSEAFRCGFRDSRGCPAIGDPSASLDEQAAYIADRFLGSAYGYIEKADFWRWRELAVSFNVPDALAQQVPWLLPGLRFTVAGRNLATFTDYNGLDPETVEGGGDSNFNQSEFNTQPPVRTLMLRLDYTF